MNQTKFFNVLSSKGRNDFFKAFNDASNEIRIALSEDDAQWVLLGENARRALLALLIPTDSDINSAKLPGSLNDFDIRMGVATIPSQTTAPQWLVLTKSIILEYEH